jgi:hypothetical protein
MRSIGGRVCVVGGGIFRPTKWWLHYRTLRWKRRPQKSPILHLLALLHLRAHLRPLLSSLGSLHTFSSERGALAFMPRRSLLQVSRVVHVSRRLRGGKRAHSLRIPREVYSHLRHPHRPSSPAPRSRRFSPEAYPPNIPSAQLSKFVLRNGLDERSAHVGRGARCARWLRRVAGRLCRRGVAASDSAVGAAPLWQRWR